MNSASHAATQGGFEDASASRPHDGFPPSIHWIVRGLLSCATVITIVAGFLNWNFALRPFAALSFFALVPGCAVVRWMRPLTPTVSYALAVPMSLAINCSFATAAIWLHIYRPSLLVLWVGGGSVYWLWHPKASTDTRDTAASEVSETAASSELPETDVL